METYEVQILCQEVCHPLPESRPPPLHYTKGKGCRGTERERERDRRAISIHAPISTFPSLRPPSNDPILPDGRQGPGHTCIHRGLHGIEGPSYNELGLETTLGQDNPIIWVSLHSQQDQSILASYDTHTTDTRLGGKFKLF